MSKSPSSPDSDSSSSCLMMMRPKGFVVREYEPGDEDGFINLQLVAPALRNDVLVLPASKVGDEELGDRVPRIRMADGTLELVQKHMVLIIDERGDKRLVGKDFVQREMVPVPVPEDEVEDAAAESDASDLSDGSDLSEASADEAVPAGEKAKADVQKPKSK